MKKNKAAKMKTVRAWAAVDLETNEICTNMWNDTPQTFKTKQDALEEMGSGMRIARVSIREVPK